MSVTPARTATARRGAVLVAVLTTALVSAGCETRGGGSANPSNTSTPTTVPTSAPPSSTPPSSTPPDTAPPPTASTAPTTSTAPTATPTRTAGTATVSVYFIQREKIVATRRAVTAPAVAAGAVRALLAGPTAAERAAGFTSTIPPSTALRGISVHGGVATIDLTGGYASGGGSFSMATRLAEVVFTLTQFRTIGHVVFALDGHRVTVFGGEGIVLDHPVGRADFETWAPAVLVESPTFGQTARSPLRVYGSANTFEAVFRLRLVDAAGRTVLDERVTATSGTGTRGTFDVTLRYRPTRAGPGKLVAWYASARDGSQVVVAVIPLDLRP